MAYHARLSPSSAARWTHCTASVGAQEGIPNEGSDASRLGTCGHQIHEECLRDPERDIQDYLGLVMLFPDEMWLTPAQAVLHDGPKVEVTQELIDAVASSLAFVRQQHALHGGELLVEQAVPIGQFTGEEGATGSADVILLRPPVLEVNDLKLGRHKVNAYEVVQPAGRDIVTGEPTPEVRRPNLQLACYALGALHEHGVMHDFTHVTMRIIQPFLDHMSEYTCTVEELREVEAFLRQQAIEVREQPAYRPSPEACHFCRASGGCEAQTRMVVDNALEGFTDVETAVVAAPPEVTLGDAYALIPLVNTWAAAVSDRVRDALAEGRPVVRSDGLAYKLVEGRATARSWTDETEVEAALKRMRLRDEQMYVRSLISPAQAEKLAKPKRAKKGETPPKPILGKTQWSRLAALITQGRAQPAIALETDPRPAVTPATDGFDDNSDLF